MYSDPIIRNLVQKGIEKLDMGETLNNENAMGFWYNEKYIVSGSMQNALFLCKSQKIKKVYVESTGEFIDFKPNSNANLIFYKDYHYCLTGV